MGAPSEVADDCDPWMAHMRRGDFAAAWRISDRVLQSRREARVDCSGWPRHLQFVWTGEPLDGKRVLVRCYHGLGDTIQFVRFLAQLRPRVAEVTLWAQPCLVELLRSARGVDRVVPLHDGAPEVDYDVDIELMELPHALRLTLEEIPRAVPYLRVARMPAPRGRADSRHIGLVWRAGDWLPQRSVPDDALAPLADIDDVRWYSLQYPARQLPFAATDLSCADICEMAARMQRLDLLITVDTMAAHLAGALGLPVWTLLNERCDWRWLCDRDDSPWYPSMRLFRQCADAGWQPVIDRLRGALRTTAGSRSSRRPAPQRAPASR
jgi:hypothetical protein